MSGSKLLTILSLHFLGMSFSIKVFRSENIFSISYYATTYTLTRTYILGGYNGYSRHAVIAEYKNDGWFYAGRLNRSRDSHCAITSGDMTMIVGGEAAVGLPWVSIKFT